MKTSVFAFIVLLHTITPLNGQQKPPVIVNDYASTEAGVTLAINVLANDYGMEGHYIKIFNAVDNQVIFTDSMIYYTPDQHYSGTRKINYVIIDTNNGLYSDIGHLFVEVINDPYEILSINNVEARVNGSGVQFFATERHPVSHYYIPKNSQKGTFRAMSLWIGGLDADSNLHFAGEKYRIQGKDFFPGPYAAEYDTLHISRWKHVWKITMEEIEFHKNNWWKQGYLATEIIATWPANGDHNMDNVVNIAPYKDYNNNGFYDPMEGDYPLIRGDEAIFFVLNDDMAPHSESNGRKMGIEVHGMAYAYDCPDDSALHHTIFFHYEIINKSRNTYYDTYIGMFADMDIGCPADDFMRTDVASNSLIGYNGKDLDGTGGIQAGFYGMHPPAQSITLLSGPLMDTDGVDNSINSKDYCGTGLTGNGFGDGIIDNERLGLSASLVFGDLSGSFSPPVYAQEYYSNLRGMWKDQSYLHYGGGGHISQGSTSQQCRFIYPGNSDLWNYGTYCEQAPGSYTSNGYFWTEEIMSHLPGSRSGCISAGPFTFRPGDKQEIDIALVFGRNYETTGKDAGLEILRKRIDMIREYYQRGYNPCDTSLAGNNEEGYRFQEVGLVAYPNPAGDYLCFSLDRINIGAFRIYDITGKEVMAGKTSVNKNEVDISRLADGLYFLIITAYSRIYHTKFIKQ